MERHRFASRNGDPVSVSGERMSAFADAFRGRLITPSDPGYDEARSIWNGMIDRRPALIARCRGEADVAGALGLAREHELRFSILSVGHNIAGSGLCDDGLVLDLAAMDGVRVDPEARTARVGPGADWGALDREAQRHGLATPGGIHSETGVAGLTLGGGFGWLTRKHGLSCDNVLEMDVVTADGERLTVDGERHPDLFWALRGGGGNFGVVTSFLFELHPLGPEVAAGLALYPMDRAEEVLAFVREVGLEAPDELGLMAVLRVAPAADFLPEEVHGEPVVGIGACWAGPPDQGMEALEPLRSFGDPVAGGFGPRPYVHHQSFLDGAQPEGRNYYWKSEYLAELEGDALEVIVRRARNLSSPHTALLLMRLGGRESRVPADATAAPMRDATWVLNIASGWEDPSESDRHVAWTRDFWREIRPHGTGTTYVNFLTADDDRERIREAYRGSYERLATIKKKYDPGNLFRPHQNVRPAG